MRRVMLAADPSDLALALPVLLASYVVRGVGWRYLFPDRVRKTRLSHVFGSLGQQRIQDRASPRAD